MEHENVATMQFKGWEPWTMLSFRKLYSQSSLLIANMIYETQVKINQNNPSTQSASFSFPSFSFFLLQLTPLPLWLSFQFTFGWVPVPLNWLHPAFFSLFASFILIQEERRIIFILSCPLTDIAHSNPPMGGRWQQIAAIFKETRRLFHCCLREGTAAPHLHTFFSVSLFLCTPECVGNAAL